MGAAGVGKLTHMPHPTQAFDNKSKVENAAKRGSAFVEAGAARARDIGLPLNRFITINFEAADVPDVGCATSRFLKPSATACGRVERGSPTFGFKRPGTSSDSTDTSSCTSRRRTCGGSRGVSAGG